MADRLLENFGTMSGTYAGTPFQDSPTSIVEVTLTDVVFEKSANQSLWFDGELVYTFTIDNTAGLGTLDAIVINDLLDNTKFSYIEDSVVAEISDNAEPPVVVELEIDTDYTVTYVPNSAAGTDSLQIALLAAGAAGSIPVGSKVTISFRGEKVPVTP